MEKVCVMPERTADISELDKFFHRVTPEALPSPQKIESMRRNLESTPQWQRFTHLSHEAKGVRHSLSVLTEKVIPWMHWLLDDPSLSIAHESKKSVSQATIRGIALHEAMSFFDLWRYGKTDPSEIDNAFPTNPQELLLPFIDALQKVPAGIGLEEVWNGFHTDRRLVDHTRYLLSDEFNELPFSQDKEQELKIRGDKKTHAEGLTLAGCLGAPSDNPDLRIYSEALGIMNFESLSRRGGSRIQIPVRFDQVACEPLGRVKKEFRYYFYDLKTGKEKTSPEAVFQALLMEFLAGHFTHEFLQRGKLQNHSKPLISRPIRTIIPPPRIYTFEYGYFDAMSTTIHEVPVISDYHSQQAEVFLEYLALISDTAVAFKKEIADYLKYGTPFDRENLRRFQDEIPAHRAMQSAPSILERHKMPPDPNMPIYIEGESPIAICCEKCGQQLFQICKVKIRGPEKSRIAVDLWCDKDGFVDEQQTFNWPNSNII